MNVSSKTVACSNLLALDLGVQGYNASPEQKAEVPPSVLRQLVFAGGVVPCRTNEYFLFDDIAMAEMTEYLNQQALWETVIDYGHSTVKPEWKAANPSDVERAAGWVKWEFVAKETPLEVEVEGQKYTCSYDLYGNYTWCQAALSKILAKEFRYTSPVLLLRYQDDMEMPRVCGIWNHALTNQPDLYQDALIPLSSRLSAKSGTIEQPVKETKKMEELLKIMGVSTEAEALTAYLLLTAKNRELLQEVEQLQAKVNAPDTQKAQLEKELLAIQHEQETIAVQMLSAMPELSKLTPEEAQTLATTLWRGSPKGEKNRIEYAMKNVRACGHVNKPLLPAKAPEPAGSFKPVDTGTNLQTHGMNAAALLKQTVKANVTHVLDRRDNRLSEMFQSKKEK